MSEKSPQRIPDWLHLLLSVVLSILALFLVYAIVFVISDLVSTHLFAIDLTAYWIGIISISLACLITYAWVRRHRARTEPVVWKRNLRWSANLILLIFLAFALFVAYRVYTKEFELPHFNDFVPESTVSSDSLQSEDTAIDSLGMEDMVMDSAHSSLDSVAN